MTPLQISKLKEILYVLNKKLFREYVRWEMANPIATNDEKFECILKSLETVGAEYISMKKLIIELLD